MAPPLRSRADDEAVDLSFDFFCCCRCCLVVVVSAWSDSTKVAVLQLLAVMREWAKPFKPPAPISGDPPSSSTILTALFVLLNPLFFLPLLEVVLLLSTILLGEEECPTAPPKQILGKLSCKVPKQSPQNPS
jgi:hypothetical protein